MASKTLYPPILDTYMPAFVAKEGATCSVYFSLSKFNSSSDFDSVHISVIKQGSGTSVVNKSNGNANEEQQRYRATGIILVAKTQITKVGDNLFCVEIKNEDILNGWTTGWIYKIQLRLSNVPVPKKEDIDGSGGLAGWLSINGHNFSEWSTVCTIKAIGGNEITIPAFAYNSTETDANINKLLYFTTLDITGSYRNKDASENLYSYQMKLYENEVLKEESGLLYANQYINSNQFEYAFNYEMMEGKDYKYVLEYETNNKYRSSETINFQISFFDFNTADIEIITAEDDRWHGESTIYEEEEEGRIGLQLYSPLNNYFGNVCIRRASALDNFKKWEDIKIITMKGETFKELGIFYDYTAASGVEYIYGVQVINEKDQTRTILNQMGAPISREFNYSFLLGPNNQQLKLKYDNTVTGYKITTKDTQTETIGSRYPFIIRNGNIYYKTFSLGGRISYNMDENNLFLSKSFMGREVEGLYDYTYEREFREKVLEFLCDDKPKLFKSPTEGNILIRLTNVQTDFEASLSRMIGSFSATATEIDYPTIESIEKYNLLKVGDIQTNYNKIVSKEKIGQLSGTFSCGENLLKLINDKYSIEEETGTLKTITKVIKISNLSIEIHSNPYSLSDTFELFGWKMNINSKDYIINAKTKTFVPGVDFTPGEVILMQDINNTKDTFEATINFTYTTEQTAAEKESYKSLVATKGIGQISGTFEPEFSVYNEIFYKYYYSTNKILNKIDALYTVKIEADKNSVFLITDNTDESHEDVIIINDTELLVLEDVENIKNIVYKGKMINGEINTSFKSNILIDYSYKLTTKTY